MTDIDPNNEMRRATRETQGLPAGIDCPGHVASDDDPMICRHCGASAVVLLPEITLPERIRRIQARNGLTFEGAQAQIDREDLAAEAAKANTIEALRAVLVKMLRSGR